MRSIILLTVFLLAGLGSVAAQGAYYKVKFPDDQTVIGCYAYPDTIYPDIEKYGNCSFNVGVSVKDQVFNLNAWGGCKKILRTWTLIYWCTYDPNEPWPVYIQNPPDTDVGATVFGVPSNRGHISYTQVIKVLDLDPPVFINCPTDPVVFCDYTGNDATQYNDGHTDKCEGPVSLGVKVTDLCSEDDIKLSYRLFLDMDGNGSMETYLSSSSPNAWPIDQMSLSGDTLMANIHFPTGHGLPYGTHKIEWIANDNCGNESLCKYTFTVKDCKAPTVVCINGLSINIMQTGMITLWDTDFIQYYFDNCTPNNQIKIGIRKSGTGTGFPTDSHSVTFDCTELGSQLVELWAVDAYGNADYCETYVIVQDNMGACPPSNKFKGKVLTDNGDPVANVQVDLKKGVATKISGTTDANGQFEIGSVASGCNYKLVPSLDAPAKLGVNTLDALLLSGQLDGVLPMKSPFKFLAADVDKSGSLTNADLQSIINVLLGQQTAFPGVPGWQFVPTSHVFADPNAPWATSVPNALTFCLTGAMPSPLADFVGYKTGDLNGSGATSQLKAASDDRKATPKAIFRTADRRFEAGNEVRVDIISPDLSAFAAFQFTLDFDPTVLSLTQVDPDLVPAEYLATPASGHLTASWHTSAMLDPTVKGKNLKLRTFTLVFQALKTGSISEVLHMSSAITEAEAYTRNLETIAATLEFELKPHTLDLGPALMPVQPNPVQENRFAVNYYLPEAGTTRLLVTDATGQVLESIQSNQDRGYHTTEVELKGAVQPGVLFIRLDAPGGSDVQRVMKL
ncbi:MAG: T9SS type A sorting domain-containing protein [Saprospiraceae bacterium]|nr:T9SS type A sorting domain-containing protein [Saprospiraceae bacterium]